MTNFFKNTLDPMVALTLIAVLDIFLFLLVGLLLELKSMCRKLIK